MPPADAIQQYFVGVWRLMTGRADGMRYLDISADGFWNSFFAIIVAFPALMVGWVTVANAIGGDYFGSRFGLLMRLALIDIAVWVVPLIILGAVAGPAGIAKRYVAYVVATNWASALFVWLMLPPALMELFSPDSYGISAPVSILIFAVTMVLSWRLTHAVIGMGPIVASAVFGGMFAGSVVLLFVLQSLFGVAPTL